MMHLHLFVVPTWLTFLVQYAVAGFAIVQGGTRERAVAAVWVFPNLVSNTLCWDCTGGSPPLRLWMSLADDVALLAICLVMMRRAERYWIVWVGSFALLSVLSDVLAMTVRGISLWAVYSANLVWLFFIAIALGWGAAQAVGAKARPVPTGSARTPAP